MTKDFRFLGFSLCPVSVVPYANGGRLFIQPTNQCGRFYNFGHPIALSDSHSEVNHE